MVVLGSSAVLVTQGPWAEGFWGPTSYPVLISTYLRVNCFGLGAQGH